MNVKYILTLGSDTAAYKITVTTKSGGGGGGGITATNTIIFDTQSGSKIDAVKVTRNNAVNKQETPTNSMQKYCPLQIDCDFA